MTTSSLGSLLGKTGASIFRDIIDYFVGDSVRGASSWAKVELADNIGFLRDITAECFDSMIEEETHQNTALSASGLINIFRVFMKTVAKASVVMPIAIVEELYTEMIQEGFSNAIQVSIGGAFQTILSTWRGGYPLNADEASEVIEAVEDLDADTMGLLIAQSGSNIPTSLFRIKQGFDRWVERELISLRTQLFEISNRLNDLMSYKVDRSAEIALRQLDEALEVYREAYSKAISLIDSVCERALSRLQELKNECETVKAWLEWSTSHPETPAVSYTHLTLPTICSV